MKVALIGINAKFIHSSLSCHSLYSYLGESKSKVSLLEFTINNDEDFITTQIYKEKPDAIAFSCYIWNIEMILDIIDTIKKIMPNTIIILGGPEVSYDYDYLACKNVDFIIVGEGEKPFKSLVKFLGENEFTFNKSSLVFGEKLPDNILELKSLAINNGGNFIKTLQEEPLSLDEIDFVYKNGFDAFKDKILYYEASRGCPFSCQYCLSSVEKGVRFLSLKRINEDLLIFLDAKVSQVKFVDRTFNCNKKHSMAIWQFLIDNDNGVTNFHFEISADILDDEIIELLKKARLGIFQFEIGVQSTNEKTLETIKRKTSLPKLFDYVQKLREIGTINMHLDLIAGLPDENFESFRQSFNSVFKYEPEQLQLGFLKVLRGSGLRENAKELGLVFREKAPYEILFTKELTHEEVLTLKSIESIVDLYYNSNKYLYSINFIANNFETPIDFFHKFSIYWEENNYDKVAHSKMKVSTILYEFCNFYFEDKNLVSIIKELIYFDISLCEKVSTLPYWLEKTVEEQSEINLYKWNFLNSILNSIKDIKKFEYLSSLTSKQLARQCLFEKFSLKCLSIIDNSLKNSEEVSAYVLFDYSKPLDRAGLATFHGSFNILDCDTV